ncbi:MAG: type II secretion system protein N [Pacificimonas sp.]
MSARTQLDRYRNWVLPGLVLLVGLSLAIALAPLTWHLLGKRTSTAAPVDIAPMSASAGADLAPVLSLAPFGNARPRPNATDSTAPTASALILKGVMMGRPAATSIAFISAPGAETEIYRAGATLPGGAVLDLVQGDRVFLLVNGRREVLGFPEASIQQGRANVRALIPAKFGGDADAAPTAPGAQTATAAASTLSTIRDRVTENPQALLSSLAAQPTPDGYVIGEDAPSAILTAGLRPGDVVTQVNGESVGEVENDRDLFEKVAAGDRARLTVRRGDKTMTLSFPLR